MVVLSSVHASIRDTSKLVPDSPGMAASDRLYLDRVCGEWLHVAHLEVYSSKIIECTVHFIFCRVHPKNDHGHF